MGRAALLVALALVFAPALSARADLPLARLWTLFPPGGQAGSTVETTVGGADLDQATQLLFSHSNIVVSLKPADKTAATDSPKFQVVIGKDVLPGIYEARVAGRFGI